MSATGHYRGVPEIVGGLVTAVTAIQWNSQPAFQEVRKFDGDDIGDAMMELYIAKQRICLVVPQTEEYDTTVSGQLMSIRRTLPVLLLISDRVLGRREEALYGNASTPGAWELQRLVLLAVAGKLLANPGGVEVHPVEVEPVILTDLKKEKPGRVVLALHVECKGGLLESRLGGALNGPNQ